MTRHRPRLIPRALALELFAAAMLLAGGAGFWYAPWIAPVLLAATLRP